MAFKRHVGKILEREAESTNDQLINDQMTNMFNQHIDVIHAHPWVLLRQSRIVNIYIYKLNVFLIYHRIMPNIWSSI